MNIFEQALSNYFNESQLNKIKSSIIGIGGAGGIGSNVAITLTRCGFKNFVIIDFDDIEPSNLNRQQYYIDEVGKSKLESLKNRMQKINPDLNIATHNIKWSPDNDAGILNNCDIIVEGFDIAETKKQFVEFYQSTVKNIISASGLAGLATDNPIKIKQIKNIFIVGNQTTAVSNDNPPLAPQVTICAAKMAEIILNLTLGSSF